MERLVHVIQEVKRTTSIRLGATAVITVILISLTLGGCRYRARKLAIARFCEITGFPFPDRAEIVFTADSHGGFNSDGEFHFIMIVPPETFAEYLQRPPFGVSWSLGPVPKEIRIYPTFGTEGYDEDDEITWLMESNKVHYSAVGWPGWNGGVHWGNGKIMVLVPTTNMVWVSQWDT